MKRINLYPDRNSMTIYKMPNSVEEAYDFSKRNNIRKLYLSDNLKYINYGFASECKNLEYVYIGTNTEMICSGYSGAFEGDKKLKVVKINFKNFKNIFNLSLS